MASNDKALLTRIADGDSAAFNDCVDTYGGLVWSLARRFCPVRSDAEDAVQEIFLDVWKNASRFDPGKGSEVTFVALIARRRLIDMNRKRQRRAAEITGEDAMNEADARSEPTDENILPLLEQAEEVRAASAVLEELKPDQQRCIRLSVQYGLTHEQIAEQTGLPLGTVKTNVRRGLLRVREELEKRSQPSDLPQSTTGRGAGS